MPGETIEEQQAFLARLDDLPSELLQYKIMPHLTPEILVWLTRENYLKYHSVVRQMVPGRDYEAYIRDMVRHDCAFVMTQLVKEHAKRWTKPQRYKFAGKSYPSFLRFLIEYAKESNAKRVHAILESIPDDNVRGKGHKRIITTTNRWTN